LDASNVELAFQNILTGMTSLVESPLLILSEIYRIVSQKALDQGVDPARPGAGASITIQPTDQPVKKEGCC
jgi:Ras-related protein Rab-11A